jgi:hypothetical protein
MTTSEHQKDLVVLAADADIEYAIRGILGRHQSLGIRALTFDVFVHAEHDPGCRTRGATFLVNHAPRYRHGLVVFDHDGCGDDRPRTDVERSVDGELQNHWQDRARTVVIAPEVENWLWSASPHVATVLGWEGRDLRAELVRQRLWDDGATKPKDPKAAVEFALRSAKKPRSSRHYMEIAAQVSLARCEDPSFLTLRQHLSTWFGVADAPSTE